MEVLGLENKEKSNNLLRKLDPTNIREARKGVWKLNRDQFCLEIKKEYHKTAIVLLHFNPAVSMHPFFFSVTRLRGESSETDQRMYRREI